MVLTSAIPPGLMDQILGPVGVTALVILILLGGGRGFWYYGKDVRTRYEEYERRLRQKDLEIGQWRDRALRGTTLAEKAVDIVRDGDST